MNPTSEAELLKVHPLLAQKIKTLADQLLAEGIEVRVTQGLRTYQEQAILYAQVRTTPGDKVTDAPPGDSYHNYGLAVDLCPGILGKNPWQPDWAVSVVKGVITPHWQRMITLGKSLGLYSGSDFKELKDYPHFQLTGVLPVGCPTPEAKELLITKGLEAVWQLAKLDNDDKSV